MPFRCVLYIYIFPPPPLLYSEYNKNSQALLRFAALLEPNAMDSSLQIPVLNVLVI